MQQSLSRVPALLGTVIGLSLWSANLSAAPIATVRAAPWTQGYASVDDLEKAGLSPTRIIARYRGEVVPCTVVVKGPRAGVYVEAPRHVIDAPFRVFTLHDAVRGSRCQPGQPPAASMQTFRLEEPFDPDRGKGAATWRSWRKADYLAIAPRAWLPTLAPLVTHRQGLGHQVAVWAAEDVYHRYSHGDPAATAIEKAITAMRAHTKGKLRFVLLVGDAERRYAPQPNAELPIPVVYRKKLKYSGIRFQRRYATDDAYATAGGTRLALGRIPARNRVDLAGFVGKLIAYETAPAEGEWRRRMVAFTGPARYGKFVDGVIEKLGMRLLDTVLPYDFDLSFMFGKQDSPYAWPATEFSQKFIGDMNRGALFAGYVGHGWDDSLGIAKLRGRDYAMASSYDASRVRIEQGNPFFVSFTCLTGAFDQVGTRRSFAEALVMNPHGAIGTFAGTRTVHPYSNATYAQAFFKIFTEGRPRTLGEGLVAVKDTAHEFRSKLLELALGSGEHLLQEQAGLFNLLGDPATRLRYPEHAVVSTSADARLRPGGPLEVAVTAPGFSDGEVLLTLETQRSSPGGALIPWSAIEAMPWEAASATMKANYATVTNIRVSKDSLTLRKGRAGTRITLPRRAGKYVVKALVTGRGRTSVGHLWVNVPPAPVNQ